MNFKELLNDLYYGLDCIQNDLATTSGLSASVISRYLSGDREPLADGEQLEALARGISQLAASKAIYDDKYKYDNILSSLKEALKYKESLSEVFVSNFNTLINGLDINMKALATGINFDVSFLYRVKSGERRPSDLEDFSTLVSEYIVEKYDSAASKAKVCELIKLSIEDISGKDAYESAIKAYLMAPPIESGDSGYMDSFFTALDAFNLDEYIKTIHFDELKVPSVPFQFPTSKKYYGIEQMKQGELDFFKMTVLSKSKEDIFMCSDMPFADMGSDTDFGKKWMFAIAMSLKKGLHLNIIHNLDRSFEEMMLGLEAWIPIYMTGQISPYHIPSPASKVYHHINYVSGSVALSGSCIEGAHNDGMYYVTNNKDEMDYYKKQAAHILSHAVPIMDIYTVESKELYQEFEASLASEDVPLHNKLSIPPLYTISEALLDSILSHSSVSEEKKTAIREYRNTIRDIILELMEKVPVTDEIDEFTEAEFNEHPVCLSLAGLFMDEDVYYTYEEYKEHLSECKAFAQANKNYTYVASSKLVFRNIQIHILENKYVFISKAKTPVIHFVIRHPQMVDSIQHFIPPV